MDRVCELCQQPADLQLSHIIPRFVWKWLKDSSPGALRASPNPNRRIQDGPKLALLCAACEQRFSAWERPFAEQVFLPLHERRQNPQTITYGDWALKFAVSVSWRSLTYLMRQPIDDPYLPIQEQYIADALAAWRGFLLGSTKHPGDFTQHLLPVEVVTGYTSPRISPFLNRYFLRSAQIDLITSQSSIYIYTKMCKILIFGRIHEKRPNDWLGLQLHAKRGLLLSARSKVPGALAEYLNEKADDAKHTLDSLSPNQRDKVDALVMSNLDNIANSDLFDAMRYDVMHSGKAAFRPE